MRNGLRIALFRYRPHLLVITKTMSVIIDRQSLILLVSRSWSILSICPPLLRCLGSPRVAWPDFNRSSQRHVQTSNNLQGIQDRDWSFIHAFTAMVWLVVNSRLVYQSGDSDSARHSAPARNVDTGSPQALGASLSTKPVPRQLKVDFVMMLR